MMIMCHLSIYNILLHSQMGQQAFSYQVSAKPQILTGLHNAYNKCQDLGKWVHFDKRARHWMKEGRCPTLTSEVYSYTWH